MMGFFKTKEEKLAEWHRKLGSLRKDREEEKKKLKILDLQFDRQASKGVTSESDRKNLKRIAVTKSKAYKDLDRILRKEEIIATKINNIRT